MPNTFMATSYDLGDAPSPFGSVHSRNKKEVGHRLAVAGLRVAYGNTSVHAGPAFDSARKDGATVVLTFRDVGAAGLALSKMNVTRALNVTQWAGDTPFEVCSAAVEGDDDPCGAMGGVDGWSAPKTTTLKELLAALESGVKRGIPSPKQTPVPSPPLTSKAAYLIDAG